MADIDRKRSILLPLLQGSVWMASIGFSVFFDFGGGYPYLPAIRKLLIFIIVTIFSELLLVGMDIKFALNGFSIEKNLSWSLQTRTIPLLTIVLCSIMPAFLYAGYFTIICLIVAWGLLKSAMLHAVSVIDAKKIEDFDIEFAEF